MKHLHVIATAILFASITLPLTQPAFAARPAKTERLMQEMLRAASKAGAMKRKLTLEVPEAKKRFEKIQKLRREVEKLNDEIDQILVGESPKYQRALQNKKTAAEKYREAKEEDAGKR